ncbi:MAG TPA: hypothetical protein VF246_06175 [Acidimicrobiia bacterium]
MNGFMLTLAPRPTWANLTRDLVASGAARSSLSVDRFSDLLVLTEQVATDLLGAATDSDVQVSLTSQDHGVEVVFAAGAQPSEVTRLALDRLADRHWQGSRDGRHVTGFAFGS